MAGEREIEEETRNQMMQNLFGDQSEEEEEEEEEEGSDPADSDSNSDSDPNRPPHPSDYPSEGEGEVDAEGQGEVEIESEADVDPEKDGREGDQRVESEEEDEEEQDEFGERAATSKRREVFASESEEERSPSERNVYVAENDDDDDEEIEQERKTRLPSAEQDNAIVRDVFGDSDEDEPANYDAQNELEQDIDVSPPRGGKVEYLPPEDLIDDRDQYESQDENLEHKRKEKPVGPPLDLEIPIRRPPSQPDKMNMIRVSNIMGIEPKPFDPKTYVEEDVFVTDESGADKRIRLEDNIVRWRSIRNRDGTISRESNARFVRWSDGSLQLLIGNEILDITVQEAQHDHTHLFLRHEKGILQSQGRLLHKMRFMPSSLASKSHRLLTALVDSRHKKVYKVKNCITDVDPEKEKEERERVEGQSNRANQLLQRKREKVNKKYTASADRGRHLSAGFLEEQIDEDDVPGDHYSYHRTAARRRFEEDMEIESRAERRIINAKRASVPKSPSRKPSSVLSRRPVGDLSESEREESEYETDGEEDDSPRQGGSGFNYDDEYGEEQPDAEVEPEEADAASEDDEEEPRQRKNVRGSRKGKEIESDEESPPRKTVNHRRMAVVFDSDEE